MKEQVCNYAIIRFLPYRETGEFVNIGVVLCSPQNNYLDFRIETAKRKRISDFFPELNKDLLDFGVKSLIDELNRVRTPELNAHQVNLFTDKAATDLNFMFKEIIKIREGIFRYGQPAVALAVDPRKLLDEVFQNAVERQFATKREYQEKVMTNRFMVFLKEWNLSQYYKKGQLGDGIYRVNMPFIHFEKETATKAVKPLDLDKGDTSRILEHGDEWTARMRRLDRLGRKPLEMIFPVRLPQKSGEERTAAEEICHELHVLSAKTVAYSDTVKMREMVTIDKDW